MGCKYVKEFDFGPPKVQVKAYARGGPVRAPVVPVAPPVAPVRTAKPLPKGRK